MAGRQVHLEVDIGRPGLYVCAGCGAPEEAVWQTQAALQEEYTRTGKGIGHIPESLLQAATLIDEPGGPRVSPFKEPWVEGSTDSGRSIAELVAKHKEITDG